MPISKVQPASPHTQLAIDWSAIAEEAAQLLSRYIQFDTTNPPGNETLAVAYLANILEARGFAPKIIEPVPGRANLIVRLPARSQAGVGPCLLYAHADVVPADPANWSMPPFGGHIENGYVWGRGALDDKGLGIIFIQALTLLKQKQVPLNRDIILLIGADEEKCGRYGVSWLLDHHRDLIEAEYVWDEGGMGLRWSSNRYLYQIAISEKLALTVKLIAQGEPGHASLPKADNPHERLVRALHRLQRWRQPARPTAAVVKMLHTLAGQQPFPRSAFFARAHQKPFWLLLQPWLKNDAFFAPLVSNTISLTVLKGGRTSNVIPDRSEAWLDARLLPGESPEAFVANLRSVLDDPAVSIEVDSDNVPPATVSSDTPFFQALTGALEDIGPAGWATPYLTPGATDSRFFRAAGMKAYGFMPMLLDEQELSRIHGIDERVSIANLEWGIRLVFETLTRL